MRAYSVIEISFNMKSGVTLPPRVVASGLTEKAAREKARNLNQNVKDSEIAKAYQAQAIG